MSDDELRRKIKKILAVLGMSVAVFAFVVLAIEGELTADAVVDIVELAEESVKTWPSMVFGI